MVSLLTRLQIALGTMILLIGVLALSWRLNNDPATRPSVSQNTLTPGMGFVDDDSDSEAEGDILKTQADAEVSSPVNGKEPPLHRRRIFSPNDPCTPTTKSKDFLSIDRLRKKGITESEEIWEELEDDALAELSPFSQRRSSVPFSSPSNIHSGGNALYESTNESTALLARSATGRSYRDRRRRRSTPILVESGRKSVSSQETLGGWWKMRKWWKGNEGIDKGKDSRKGNSNSNGNGP